MSKSTIFKTSLAAVFLLGTTFFVASKVAQAQQAVDPSELRAADSTEQEFANEEQARAADEAENADPSRLMIVDANGHTYINDGVRDGFTCRARRVPVQRVYRRMTRCGFGQQQYHSFIQQPSAYLNQQGPFIMQQQGGAFPQQYGFDPGAVSYRDADERLSSDEDARKLDEDDNDESSQSRMFQGWGTPYGYNSRPAGMWCRTVRVPTRIAYRRTINCGRY